MFEDPAPHKMGSPTPMVWPLDESQRPSPFHGHGSWLVCEVALILSGDPFLKNLVGGAETWQITVFGQSFGIDSPRLSLHEVCRPIMWRLPFGSTLKYVLQGLDL